MCTPTAIRWFLLCFLASPAILWPLKHPTAQEWLHLLWFSTVEVGRNLFLPKCWIPVVFVLANKYKLTKWGLYIWVVFGLCQWLRFVNYYFVPLLPSSISPACVSPKGCSVWEDELAIFNQANKGGQVWVDDAVCMTILAMLFMYFETPRWRLGNTGYVCMLLTALFGYDVGLPLFLLEMLPREEGTQRPAASVDRRWLYLVLAMVSLWFWFPNLYQWQKLVGTVDGQLHAGLQNPWVYRCTMLVMGAAFSMSSVYQAEIVIGDSVYGHAVTPMQATVLTWVTRFLWLYCVCANVAAAWATLLYFREMTQCRSFRFDPAKATGRDQ